MADRPAPFDSSTGLTLVKLGGALLADGALGDAFWDDVRTYAGAGPLVIVHGGGPQATALARRLGHEPRMVHGRRVTTETDLEIVQWTIRGALNASLAAQAHRRGIRAAGVSGADGGLVRVTRRPPWTVDDETIDFGWVGDVVGVETALLETLLRGGFVPIVAPLGIDDEGLLYNVNADTVARSLAAALGVRRFLLVTEAGGVRRDPSAPASRLDTCDVQTFEEGVADGWIQAGMRVKLQVAFEAARAGTPEVYIVAPDHLAAPASGTRVVV